MPTLTITMQRCTQVLAKTIRKKERKKEKVARTIRKKERKERHPYKKGRS